MNRILKWIRVPGLLSLGSAAILGSCEGPTAPAGDFAKPSDVATSRAKKTGLEPAVTPLCPEPYDPGRVLCRIEVNTKHGNDNGLPANLKGVKNGSQFDGKGNGASLTVSVLGTLEFNLSAVYLNTLRLGDVETAPPLTPVSLLQNGEYHASIVDLNGDGILDLLLHFSIPEMVDNGDISETTTRLCLYGEGPGYVLNGCGVDSGDPPPPPPPPPYADLVNCDFETRPKHGYRCAMIQPYGRDEPAQVKALPVEYYWSDAHILYPNWLSLPVDSLTGPSPVYGKTWRLSTIPFGAQSPAAAAQTTYDLNGNGLYEPFLTECGLTPSSALSYPWGISDQLLVRTDITIPQGAQNVRVEFIVDDMAHLYFNGVELTSGWMTSGAAGTCVTYEKTILLQVPADLIVAGGINKLGIWASDWGGWVHYLDFRIFADVPIS